MPPTKLEVNAAIDRLLSEKNPHNLSDALPIIEFMKCVELSDMYSHQKSRVVHYETPENQNSDEVSRSSKGLVIVQVGFYEMYIKRAEDGKMIISLQHSQQLEMALRKGQSEPSTYYLICSEDFIPECLCIFEKGERVRKLKVNLRIGQYYYRVESERVSITQVILRGLEAGIRKPMKDNEITRIKTRLPWYFSRLFY